MTHCVLLSNAKGRATARQTRLIENLSKQDGIRAALAPLGDLLDCAGAIRFAGFLEVNDASVGMPPPSLVEAGVVPAGGAGLSHNQMGRRLMDALAQRGVSVNWESRICGVGIKSTLEKRCREQEAAGGESVPRPVTVLRRNAAAAPPLDADWRIAKRVNGTRAEAISILRRGEETPAVLFPCVEQELIADPSLLDGYKFDCRAYVMVWNRPEFGYAVSRYERVRHAAALHQRGVPEAEICSTSFSRRQGMAAHVSDLGALEAAAEGRMDAVRPALQSALAALMRLVAGSVPATPFFAIWGVDVAPLGTAAGGIGALVLEVNAFPQIYNGDDKADALTDRLLVPELAACLRRHTAEKPN